MNKIVLLVGIVCLVTGGLFAAGLVGIPDEKTLVSMGEASLSVETREQAPPVLGYGLLAAGAVLIAGALVLRRH